MCDYVYDKPTQPPQPSAHWQSLDHQPGDTLWNDLEEVRLNFHSQVIASKQPNDTKDSSTEDANDGDVLAFWSCLLGYCEALTTHKNPGQRHDFFPIPVSALERLVRSEFHPTRTVASNQQQKQQKQQQQQQQESSHRRAARDISNWIWARVTSKTVKDELHANSLYTILRGGQVDRKSVDCFGAALGTVIKLRQWGYSSSTLTLSEDHAYESHQLPGDDSSDKKYATCEVAIPGSTKAQQAKRACEIADTLKSRAKMHSASSKTPSSATPTITLETSWLYMQPAVRCHSVGMILAAALANVNPTIGTCTNKRITYSEPLIHLTRTLLWELYDAQALDRFPFALCELAYAEENCTTARGQAWQNIPTLCPDEPVTTMEALYWQAIQCSSTHYADKQVYPYEYMAGFHKNAAEEPRKAAAMQYLAEAARVAASYPYDWTDTGPLAKNLQKFGDWILADVLKQSPWQSDEHAVATARHLLAFHDSLLAWEERAGQSFLSGLVRKEALTKCWSRLPQTARQQVHAHTLQSTRLSPQRTLRAALLQSPKVVVSDLDVAILSDEPRRRKRRKVD